MDIKDFFKKLWSILYDGDLDFTELVGVLNYVMCAAWMYSHPTLFAQGIVYRTINLLGDANFWASIFFLFAVTKLFCIYIDRYRARKWVALASFFLWLFLLISFYQNNSSALINVFIFEVMFMSAVEYWRHREHAYQRAQSRKRLNLP